MQSVRVDQLHKRFGVTAAVAGIDLEIRAGEFFTLLGPSGCGKTTLLRLIAGLEVPDLGTIHFGTRQVDQDPPHLRNIGMVFQSYALFPHMSVAANIAYGLKARRVPVDQIEPRVHEALALVQMEEFGPRAPATLSGGQQQRVALARALATRPAVLLMDEPLTNLDAQLRVAMRDEIWRLQRRVGITTLYVTHDQEEALAISDRIGVMEGGLLKQVGTPGEIYGAPATREVAGFVGACSFLAATVMPGDVAVLGQRFRREFAQSFEGPVWLALRPERVRLLPPGWEPPGEVVLEGKVEAATFLGAFTSVRVGVRSGEVLTALSPLRPESFPVGLRVTMAFRPEEALFFKTEGGGALR